MTKEEEARGRAAVETMFARRSDRLEVTEGTTVTLGERRRHDDQLPCGAVRRHSNAFLGRVTPRTPRDAGSAS